MNEHENHIQNIEYLLYMCWFKKCHKNIKRRRKKKEKKGVLL